MNVLILADDFNQARLIEDALSHSVNDATSFKVFCLEGMSFGLPRPEMMVPKGMKATYRRWSFENMPWDAGLFDWQRKEGPGTQELVGALREKLKGSSEVCFAYRPQNWPPAAICAWEAISRAGWTGPVSRMSLEALCSSGIMDAFHSRSAIASLDEDGDLACAQLKERIDILALQYMRASTILASKLEGAKTLIDAGVPGIALLCLIAHLRDDQGDDRQDAAFYKDELGNAFLRAGGTNAKSASPSALAPSCKVCLDYSVVRRRALPRSIDLIDVCTILAGNGHGLQGIVECAMRMYQEGYITYPGTRDGRISPSQGSRLRQSLAQAAHLCSIDLPALSEEPAEHLVGRGIGAGALRIGEVIPRDAESLSALGKCAVELYALIAKAGICMFADDYVFESRRAYLFEHPEFSCEIEIPISLGYRAVLDADRFATALSRRRVTNGFGKRADMVVENPLRLSRVSDLTLIKERSSDWGSWSALDKMQGLCSLLSCANPLLAQSDGRFALTQRGILAERAFRGCEVCSAKALSELSLGFDRARMLDEDSFNLPERFSEMIARDLPAMQANFEK